jgi:hypothetical protein
VSTLCTPQPMRRGGARKHRNAFDTALMNTSPSSELQNRSGIDPGAAALAASWFGRHLPDDPRLVAACLDALHLLREFARPSALFVFNGVFGVLRVSEPGRRPTSLPGVGAFGRVASNAFNAYPASAEVLDLTGGEPVDVRHNRARASRNALAARLRSSGYPVLANAVSEVVLFQTGAELRALYTPIGLPLKVDTSGAPSFSTQDRPGFPKSMHHNLEHFS